jgi:hypothetical protein
VDKRPGAFSPLAESAYSAIVRDLGVAQLSDQIGIAAKTVIARTVSLALARQAALVILGTPLTRKRSTDTPVGSAESAVLSPFTEITGASAGTDAEPAAFEVSQTVLAIARPSVADPEDARERFRGAILMRHACEAVVDSALTE